MIICLCNRLTAKSIQEAASSGRCRTVGEVYRYLQCRVQCGKCVPEVRRLFEDARAQKAGRGGPASPHEEDEPTEASANAG